MRRKITQGGFLTLFGKERRTARYSKNQLQLFGLTLFTAGVVVGLYLAASEVILPRILAADSPWTQTDWSGGEGTSISTQYSAADNTDGTKSAGQITLTNNEELTNTGFESDLADWSGEQSYDLQDEFTTDRTPGSVGGTEAEDTEGNSTGSTRTVTDTNNKISISSGVLSFASGAAANDGVWYDAQTRTPGKVLVVKVTPADDAGMIAVGWDTGTSGAINDALVFNAATGIQIVSNGKAAVTVDSYSAATTYDVAAVTRASGMYWFIRGGSWANWTLLHATTEGSTENLYPAVQAQNATSVFTVDLVHLATDTWLPTPLAYDTFGREDGSMASTETTGQDSQATPQLAWTGVTWSVAANHAYNTPTLGSELVTNGSFETGNPPSNWSTSGSPTTFEQSSNQAQDGTYSLHLVTDENNEGSRQNLTMDPNTWYFYSGYNYPVVGTIYFWLNPDTDNDSFLYQTANQWNFNYGAGLGSRQTHLWMSPYGNYESYFDNVSLRALTTGELLVTVPSSTADVLAETAVTLASDTHNHSPTGLVLRADSAANPQNFLLAFVIKNTGGSSSGVVKLFKCVNGVYTRLFSTQLQPKGTSYANGKKLQVALEGSAVRVYYDGILINTATVADGELLNNTLHGIFSTHSGGFLDDFNLVARGTGGEYTDLPGDDLMVTRDTGIKYNGAAGAELTATNEGKFVQTINVGDTDKYNLVAYVYSDGGEVTDDKVELFYNGAAVTTAYTDMGDGWYRLAGTVTGANEAREYGVQVKQGQTVYVDDLSLNNYAAAGTLTSAIFDTGFGSGAEWLTLTYSATTPANTTTAVRVRTSNSAGMTGATAFGECDAVVSGADITANDCVADGERYVQYQVALANTSTETTSIFNDISIAFLEYDAVPPETNASEIVMTRSLGGTEVELEAWTNNPAPYFSWRAGDDNENGSGLMGYCLYLGTDPEGDPATSKGLLGTSPVDVTYTTCQFVVPGTLVNLATTAYRGSTWLTTSDEPYYLNIKAIDNGRTVYAGDAEQFVFYYDDTLPTNIAYLSCASGSFSNVVDMNFTWPTTGAAAAADASQSGVLGWQYQINATDGTWLGTTSESLLGVGSYIPVGETTRTLTQEQDGDAIVSGNNVVYLRAVDAAGNLSAAATYRTCHIAYGGAAPAFDGLDTVTVTPATATANFFALTWPEATATVGQAVTNYYYMVNTPPPSTLATLQGNASTYLDNGTARTLAAGALPNVNKGANTVYVVAIDDADTPNYSPSNYISGTFTLNSTDPDNVGDLVASDSSIKAKSQWNVTLTWTAPVYQGAGNLTYLIYRSTDGTSFSQVGSTSGLSYVDSTPTSALYYYKIYSRDGAEALSSGTNALAITPTGRWTSPPTLESGPTVSSITTKKATVSWSTSRTSDSSVVYGTSTGTYYDEDVGNTSQVTAHTVNLTNLAAGMTYYYKVRWTDEDGNTGESEEKSFSTDPAPVAKEVTTTGVSLTSATVNYTVTGAAKVRVYYGETTSFGGLTELSTATSETSYSTVLTGLSDGTKYYFKINCLDEEDEEYEGTVLDFTTLPRPKITGVRLQQVVGTAQPTVLVSWQTNTEVSSIVTYYPQGQPDQARDEVNVALVKGEHKMILRGLLPQTAYALVVKGRDKVGNEAVSDSQTFTTATDTRPPQISDLKVEGTTSPTANANQEPTAQLIVSWNTDEPTASQVEFGEGTGASYAQKTQEDTNLTFNHLVVISGLTPSRVYHLRALAKDKAGNTGTSIDTVTITPKATQNALDLVISNLQEAFGFLGGIR